MWDVSHPARRTLLAAGLGAVASGALAQTAPSRPARPRDVGRKFMADGRVRGFAGNTIISPVPQQGDGYAVFDRLLDIYRDLPGHAFARKITALPTSSYHMTIFGGADDQARQPGLWPEGVPLDAPMARCNAILAERLKGFRMGAAPPFRMVVDDHNPPDKVSPVTLQLRPVDAQENAKLRQVRDRLADALKIRAPDHDRYQFHITIAYQIDWFTPEEQADYAAALQGWRRALQRQNVVFSFGAPEYCVFEDMFAFQRQFALA